MKNTGKLDSEVVVIKTQVGNKDIEIKNKATL